jgi:AcrR family transcriptional regulator
VVKSSKKQLQLQSAARELFWKFGFRRVTIEEICEKAVVSKMTFYKFFPDKISIAKAVFQKEVEFGMTRFREIMNSDASPAEKVRAMMMTKAEATNNISREFLNDFYSSEKTELVGFVQELTMKTWTDAIEDFRKAQEKGVFRKDFKPEFLFLLSQRMSEVITDPKFLALYASPHDLLVEMSRFFCYGISPHDEQ